MGSSGNIAYLTSEYPAPSHTFIRREVEQLRKTGMNIKTYSIRQPVPNLDSPVDKAMQAETFYVLNQGIAAYLGVHLKALLLRPRAYWRQFRRALAHRVPGVRAFLWSIFHFAESIVLAAQLERDNIGHLHNHFGNSAANVGMLAAQFAKIPWSLTLHGISETDYPAGMLLKDKIAAAKFVACVSWFGRAQAMRISSPDHWYKFHIVRCGIDLAELPQQGKKSGEAGNIQIICVARLSAEKGHMGLLEALKGLKTRGITADTTLVGDGPLHKEISATVMQLGLENQVRLLGKKSEQETLDLIAKSDLLVLPSFMEGLPVVLMEAMALGVLVISSRVAGVPELIDDGKNGILFHPANWMDLENELYVMISDPEKRAKIAQAGQLKIAKEFEISVATAELSALFND